MKTNRLAAGVLACAMLAAVAPIAAAQSDDVTRRNVQYTNLDLASDAGSAALDRRITSAVNSVCRANGQIDLSQHIAVCLCRRESLADARHQRDLARANRTGTALALRSR